MDKLHSLIQDINPAEIASHIESGNLAEWCNVWRTAVKEALQPKTNADRIRSMSDEELAKAIRIHVGSSQDVACCYCHCDKGCINADGGINCDDKTEETCIVAWLRQPVTQPHPGADDNHDHSGLLEE